MTTPPCHSLLFMGALLLALLPALHAADRAPSSPAQAPQAAPPAPKNQSFFSRLFGGKTRPGDTDTRKRAAALPRSQMPQFSASQPTRSADTTRTSVQPLPRSPTNAVMPPLSAVNLTPPPLPAPPSLAPASATLPGGRQASLTANVPAASPLFAQPVPGKPGCVYPPGVQRIPANIVDVFGMHPGTRARDPLTNVVFVVP